VPLTTCIFRGLGSCSPTYTLSPHSISDTRMPSSQRLSLQFRKLGPRFGRDRDDTCVHHPSVLHTINSQLGVNHAAVLLRKHHATAERMVECKDIVPLILYLSLCSYRDQTQIPTHPWTALSSPSVECMWQLKQTRPRDLELQSQGW
jgi:hypothetical protein